MFKMLTIAGLAAALTACAAAPAPVADDPLRASRGSTPIGAAKAAQLGFHGPVYRSSEPDGPN